MMNPFAAAGCPATSRVAASKRASAVSLVSTKAHEGTRRELSGRWTHATTTANSRTVARMVRGPDFETDRGLQPHE
jgi:hypothetical protein